MALADLKITFLAGDLGQGGAERQLYYILKALKSLGAQINLLALTSGEYWESPLQSMGVRVQWAGRTRSRLGRLIAIARFLKENRPSIFQSQHFYANCYVAFLSRVMGIRDVAAMRNNGDYEVRANGRVMGKLNLRLPRMIAANSKGAIRYARKAGIPAARLFYLPNVVDTDHFRPAPARATRAVRILAAGRLVQQKRFDRFLTLVAEVNRRSKAPIRATVIGGGTAEENLKPRLQRQAAELGLLPDVVRFEDPIASMSKAYEEADIFVMTSDYEGTPNVLLEAMASGLPVVATAVGDVGEIIRSGDNGFIAEPADMGTLSKALLNLVQSRQLREGIGNQARKYIELHRSERVLPAFLENLYHLALS